MSLTLHHKKNTPPLWKWICPATDSASPTARVSAGPLLSALMFYLTILLIFTLWIPNPRWAGFPTDEEAAGYDKFVCGGYKHEISDVDLDEIFLDEFLAPEELYWAARMRPFFKLRNKYFAEYVFRAPSADNAALVPASGMISNMLILKNEEYFKYDFLNDLYAVDNFGMGLRFSIVYRLANLDLGTSLIIVTCTDEGFPAASVADLYPSSLWAEREAWEMHGVYFSGHTNLQRLLTDYAFKGHPLRKDFPMTGYLECFYAYRYKTIEFVKVEFMQEYRRFEFVNSWEAPAVGFAAEECDDEIAGLSAAYQASVDEDIESLQDSASHYVFAVAALALFFGAIFVVVPDLPVDIVKPAELIAADASAQSAVASAGSTSPARKGGEAVVEGGSEFLRFHRQINAPLTLLNEFRAGIYKSPQPQSIIISPYISPVSSPARRLYDELHVRIISWARGRPVVRVDEFKEAIAKALAELEAKGNFRREFEVETRYLNIKERRLLARRIDFEIRLRGAPASYEIISAAGDILALQDVKNTKPYNWRPVYRAFIRERACRQKFDRPSGNSSVPGDVPLGYVPAKKISRSAGRRLRRKRAAARRALAPAETITAPASTPLVLAAAFFFLTVGAEGVSSVLPKPSPRPSPHPRIFIPNPYRKPNAPDDLLRDFNAGRQSATRSGLLVISPYVAVVSSPEYRLYDELHLALVKAARGSPFILEQTALEVLRAALDRSIAEGAFAAEFKIIGKSPRRSERPLLAERFAFELQLRDCHWQSLSRAGMSALSHIKNTKPHDWRPFYWFFVREYLIQKLSDNKKAEERPGRAAAVKTSAAAPGKLSAAARRRLRRKKAAAKKTSAAANSKLGVSAPLDNTPGGLFLCLIFFSLAAAAAGGSADEVRTGAPAQGNPAAQRRVAIPSAYMGGNYESGDDKLTAELLNRAAPAPSLSPAPAAAGRRADAVAWARELAKTLHKKIAESKRARQQLIDERNLLPGSTAARMQAERRARFAALHKGRAPIAGRPPRPYTLAHHTALNYLQVPNTLNGRNIGGVIEFWPYYPPDHPAKWTLCDEINARFRASARAVSSLSYAHFVDILWGVIDSIYVEGLFEETFRDCYDMCDVSDAEIAAGLRAAIVIRRHKVSADLNGPARPPAPDSWVSHLADWDTLFTSFTIMFMARQNRLAAGWAAENNMPLPARVPGAPRVWYRTADSAQETPRYDDDLLPAAATPELDWPTEIPPVKKKPLSPRLTSATVREIPAAFL